jgi:ribonuclease HI
MRVELYIDGAARGNPGPAACGVLIRHEGEDLLERAEYLGRTTNNVAEYKGLLLGLKLAQQLGATHVAIHSDSELLVRQIQGRYKVKAAHLRPLYREARKALEALRGFTIQHVPRAENRAADGLANQALDERGAN